MEIFHIKAPAECKTSVYILLVMEIWLHYWSKWLGPYRARRCDMSKFVSYSTINMCQPYLFGSWRTISVFWAFAWKNQKVLYWFKLALQNCISKGWKLTIARESKNRNSNLESFEPKIYACGFPVKIWGFCKQETSYEVLWFWKKS